MSGQNPRAERIRLSGQKLRADLTELVTEVTRDYGRGSVAQMTLRAVDPTGLLRNTPLAALGTTVTLSDEAKASFEVGAIDADFRSQAIVWDYQCRSTLARRLRNKYRVGAEQKVSPSEWVTKRVTEEGGTVVTQPSPYRVAIGQAKGEDAQSTLDVISSMASEMRWDWAEVDGTFYFCDPYWVLNGNANTRVWPVTYNLNERTDARALQVSLSDDDTESAGSLDLTLSHGNGTQIRPFDRIRLNAGSRYDGLWLVDSVGYTDDTVSEVDVTCSRPRRPAPSKPATDKGNDDKDDDENPGDDEDGK